MSEVLNAAKIHGERYGTITAIRVVAMQGDLYSLDVQFPGLQPPVTITVKLADARECRIGDQFRMGWSVQDGPE